RSESAYRRDDLLRRRMDDDDAVPHLPNDRVHWKSGTLHLGHDLRELSARIAIAGQDQRVPLPPCDTRERRKQHDRTRQADHHGPVTIRTDASVPKSGSRPFGTRGSSTKIESSTMKPYT